LLLQRSHHLCSISTEDVENVGQRVSVVRCGFRKTKKLRGSVQKTEPSPVEGI
jgi:hypothetical protein